MRNNIEQFLELIMLGRPCVELRTVNPPRFKIFDSVTAASNWAVEQNVDKDIYFTMNPHSCEVQKAVTDKDVTRRTWILVDIDPVRGAEGHPASEDERAAAISMAERCRHMLEAMGVPENSSILVSSGNGAHLYVRVDLPNDNESKYLVKDVLKFLNETVIPDVDYHCDVDQSVFNAARISKLVGTFARKGTPIEGREHVKATILKQPDRPVTVTPLHVLKDIASRVQSTTTETESELVSQLVVTDDPVGWMEEHGVTLKPDQDPDRPKVLEGGAMLWEIVCPFHPESHNGANVIHYPDGGLVFGCHGNRCVNKTNAEFIRHYCGEHYDTDLDIFKDNPLEPVEECKEESDLDKFMQGFTRLDEIKPEPVDYLVDELIGAGKLTMISGRWKAGKSSFVGDMVRSLAMGQEWLGRKTKLTKVLICSEETADVFGRRYESAEAAAKQNVLVNAMYKRPTKAEFRKICVLLKQAMIRTGSDLLILDTLMATTPMDDENNNSEAQVFMQILRTEILEEGSGRTILMIHHCGKEGSDARGASAISGATDCNVTFDYASSDSANNDRKIAAKGRFPTTDMIATYVEDTGRYELVSEGGMSKSDAKTQALYDILKQAGYEGLDTDDLLSKAKEHPVFNGVSGKTIQNSFSKAVKAGIIERTMEGRKAHYFVTGVKDFE